MWSSLVGNWQRSYSVLICCFQHVSSLFSTNNYFWKLHFFKKNYQRQYIKMSVFLLTLGNRSVVSNSEHLLFLSSLILESKDSEFFTSWHLGWKRTLFSLNAVAKASSFFFVLCGLQMEFECLLLARLHPTPPLFLSICLLFGTPLCLCYFVTGISICAGPLCLVGLVP